MSRLDEVLGTAILKGKKALGKEAPEVLRLPLDLLRVRGQPRRRFENLEALRQAVPAARNTTLENAVRFVGGAIPYHEGALRYFREAGALK